MPEIRKRLIVGCTAVAVITSATYLAAQTHDPVQIGDVFAIDRTEVTIAQFRAFAEASQMRTQAEKYGGGFEFAHGWEKRPGWTVYQPFGETPASEKEPAVHVSWQEATDYCAWRGGRLPSANEWRMAAYTETGVEAGGSFVPGRTYPYPSGEEAEGMNTSAEDPWPRHAAVGTTRPGINGLFDMGGNVWEWVADRDGENALTAGGSSWYGPDETMDAAMQWKPADFFALYVGFRCVYNED